MDERESVQKFTKTIQTEIKKEQKHDEYFGVPIIVLFAKQYNAK